MGLLCAAVIVQTSWFRETSSITFDETYNLSLSLRSLRKGALDRQFIWAGTAPFPMILNYFPALGWDMAQVQNRSDPGSGVPGDGRLIALPRLLTTLTSLVPMVTLAFFWLRERRGVYAATFGAGLLAFSPTLLAHASLATHDMTLALHTTLALIVMGAYLRSPSRWRLLAAALTTSLAVSSKYTGVLLVPCFLLALTVRNLSELLRSRQDALPAPGWSWVRYVLPGVQYVVLTLTFTWAVHGFQVVPGSPGGKLAQIIPATAKKVERPGFVCAIRHVMLHNRKGHPAFLMGMRSPDGWWSYFPVAVLLKSTFPELLLVLSATTCLAISPAGRLRFDVWSIDPHRAILLLFAGTLTLVLLSCHINIGHRYTIALYPVAVLWSTDLLAETLADRRLLLWTWTAAAFLLGAQVVTSLATAPHYLSYFNRLAGGPEQGWKYLVDSNIDWGQDLPALKRLIEREGYRRVACDYFGTASLEGYGIQAETIGSLSRPLAEYDAFAVSVTQLQSVYPRGFDLRLMSALNDVSGIPTEGKNLIIVAAVNHVLHFRIFDGDGKLVVDTDKKSLADQAQPIEDLRKRLESLWPPHEMTRSEKAQGVTAVTSIIGHTHPRVAERVWQIVDSYRALRGLCPTHRAGHSIFVYDLRSPVVRAAFITAVESIAKRL